MRRIDYIIESSTPPQDKRVLWLDNGVLKYCGTDDWLPLLTDDTKRVRKVSRFLYSFDIERVDYNLTKFPKVSLGGCSSFRSGNLLCRNYDWFYNRTATFVVRTPAYDDRYATLGVAGGIKELTEFLNPKRYNKLLETVPFYLIDGINEKKVLFAMNVVPNDYGTTTGTTPLIENRGSVNGIMLGRFILDNFDDAETAIQYIKDYISVYIPETLREMGYELHYLVGDEDKTYVLEIVNNSWAVVEHNAITNFFINGVTFNEDGTVYTPADVPTHLPSDDNGITDFGAGLERYNIIADNIVSTTTKAAARTLLDSLYFTKAYNTTGTIWNTDFVGKYSSGNLTVDSTPEQFAPIIEKAQEFYTNRTRDVENTWITAHSAIYDLDKMELYLISQEGDREYTFKMWQ